jgi:acetyl-CoA acyltransferase
MFRNTRPTTCWRTCSAVVARPGHRPGRIGDAIIGCAMPEAEQGMNVARIGVLLAGLPNTVPATVNRFCSSGLQAVAMAADASASASRPDDRRRHRVDERWCR